MSLLLLVRHGQASFGADDYDRLSEHGREQGRTLGAALRERGVAPSLVVTGGMRRQRETADEVARSAEWSVDVDTDSGWDEFSASALFAAHKPLDEESRTNSRAFQRALEEASRRWASGEFDDDYAETFYAFTTRVQDALKRVAQDLGRGETAVVVSSAGTIAWAAAHLIHGGFEQWQALNRVAVNSAMTKIVVGGAGTSLVGFNDHSHLGADQITYR